MKIKDVASFLESLAPLAWQEDYDNAGLTCGNPEQELTGVLVTLDVTDAVLEEAESKRCNLIVSHHPVIFRAVKKITPGTPEGALMMKAIQKGIALYAIHTNLDNWHQGVSAILCEKLGIKNLRVLAPRSGRLRKLVTFCPSDYAAKVREALFKAGAGHIGNYDACSYNLEGFGTFRAQEGANPFVGEVGKIHHENEVRIETIFPDHIASKLIGALLAAHPYEEVAYDIYPLSNEEPLVGSGMTGELDKPVPAAEFLATVKQVLGIPVIRHTELTGRKIQKVACCGGSGAFLIPDARRAGAELFLTGDIKYHEFFQGDRQMILADIGHYESEQFAKELIANVLIKNFSNFAVLISEEGVNPVNYL